MKIWIPRSLARKKRPGPHQAFACGSHDNEIFGFAAANEAFIERMQRILAMDGTECGHIQQTAQGGSAHFGNGRTSAHPPPTLIWLRIQADKSGETLSRPLPGRKGLPAMQLHQVGNFHFAISGTYGLGDIRTTQGRLHEGVKTYQQVLQLALAQGEPLLRGTADLYPSTNDAGQRTEPSPPSTVHRSSSLVEPLSEREIEVLQLIAQGLSNQEICERLFLALSTVKGHNRNIFGKLQVQRRTEAVARARELGLV